NHMIMVGQQIGQYYGGEENSPRGPTQARGGIIVEAGFFFGGGPPGLVFWSAHPKKKLHPLPLPQPAAHSPAAPPPRRPARSGRGTRGARTATIRSPGRSRRTSTAGLSSCSPTYASGG